MSFGASYERVREMVRKEFIQILRDARLRRIVFIAPILQLIVFGYAVSTDVRDTKLFVVDHDRSSVSRELIDALTQPGYFRVVGRSDRPVDLVQALERGKAVVGIEIPPNLSEALGDRESVEVQVLVDGTNSNTAIVAKGYAERIIMDFGRRAAGSPAAPRIDLRVRAWYNPGLVSRIYNVPAVAGVIIMLVCLLLTSLAVVREREIGTLEQLMVSPLRPLELIAGKTIPFAVFGLIDLAIVTSVAVLWFRIPFEGNLALLLLASGLFLLSGLGVGLFVSTISRTQQEAFMASFLFFMPTILLSGFMFPVSSMPKLFQWLTLLNPMRQYLEIVRAIFLKGAGLTVLWRQHLALLVMGVGILVFAASRFRKTIE
ncbi:MAG: ABC transporter permease [Candidatus Eisenbacteria bacterium]|uniref:Transport permease protein n=1 Tax=Eiseniibacteriota bacterium TaxID=2212470 RepID=A0A948W942_UNCEI|nr:ABC transporter permease [Candidatus Eisenbacteria bacterium]MBU1947180.1 ABC transporter permease [Candidatus Eisenbacteria bacterium]MBU2693371.1 ABC transporter permease [Candidatus Eisenbacteria bacterium]